MFIVVHKTDARKVYAPQCGVRALRLESNQDTQERWDGSCGRWYRWHLDLLACTWVMDGDENELARAKEWAQAEGWTAEVVPPDEDHRPLVWARARAAERFWGLAMEAGTL